MNIQLVLVLVSLLEEGFAVG